jgi:hypothetical protein
MKNTDFIICAPLSNVNSSNGILALVELARSIEKAGRSAYICVSAFVNNEETIFSVDFDRVETNNDSDRKFIERVKAARTQFGIKLLTDFTQERIDQCYVVYPEVMCHNVLRSKRVIRYFLNKDGNLRQGKKVEVGPSDFILAHSKTMHAGAHHVAYYSALNPLFNRKNTYLAEQRNMDITYIGKGELYGVSGRIPNTVMITRSWPETKEELAALLRNCRFFYTGDSCSNINVEALACGAIPAFLHNGPWTDEEIDGTPTGAFPRLYGGITAGENFFAEFEVARTHYLERVQQLADSWDANIAQFIDKVDAHFAPRSMDAMRVPLQLDRIFAAGR